MDNFLQTINNLPIAHEDCLLYTSPSVFAAFILCAELLQKNRVFCRFFIYTNSSIPGILKSVLSERE